MRTHLKMQSKPHQMTLAIALMSTAMAGASKPHKSMIGIFKKVITTTKLEKTKLKGVDISLHLVAQPDCRRLKELGSYRTRILIIVFALIPCKANGCRTGSACPFASCVANQGHTVIQCHTIHQCMRGDCHTVICLWSLGHSMHDDVLPNCQKTEASAARTILLPALAG